MVTRLPTPGEPRNDFGTANTGTIPNVPRGRQPPDPRVLEKRRYAVELFSSGHTLESIAEKVGYAGHSGARAAVRRGLQDALWEAGSEEIRQREISLLDQIIVAHKKRATDVEHPDPAHARILVDCVKLRAQLEGVDKPAPIKIQGTMEHKHAHLVIDPEPGHLGAILAALSEVQGDHPSLAALRALGTGDGGDPQVVEVLPAYTNGEADSVPAPRRDP